MPKINDGKKEPKIHVHDFLVQYELSTELFYSFLTQFNHHELKTIKEWEEITGLTKS